MAISILSAISSGSFFESLKKATKLTGATLLIHDGPAQFQNALTTARPDIVFFNHSNPEIESIVTENLNRPSSLEDQPVFALIQESGTRISDFFLNHLDYILPPDAQSDQIRILFNVSLRIRALKEAYLLTLDLADLSQKKLSEAEESWVVAREELEAIAHHDALTGLYNRKFMEMALRDTVTTAKKNQFFLSMMMLDIDHFKNINDTYGHQVGDEVLKRVAHELQMGIRKSDVVARYGGEEMIGILVGTSSKDALLVAEKTRQRIADIQFFAVPIQKKADDTHFMLVEVEHNQEVRCLLFPQTDADANATVESQWAENIWMSKIRADLVEKSKNPDAVPSLPMAPISITASFGISTYPDDFTLSSKGNALLESTSEEDLMIYMADKALYKAKKSGRNKTLTYYGIQCASDDSIPIIKTADQLMTRLRAKDNTTFLHSLRVGLMAYTLAKALKLPDSEQEIVKWSGILHDIGKSSVATAILLKPDRLTKDEFDAMKMHPEFGAAMAREYKNLEKMIPGILYHHERWNGAGYPDKLGTTEIPEVARILGIVDTYDAMTGSRPYRFRTEDDPEKALTEIVSTAGTLYDPEMVKVFEGIIADIKPIIGLDEKALRLALDYPY